MASNVEFGHIYKANRISALQWNIRPIICDNCDPGIPCIFGDNEIIQDWSKYKVTHMHPLDKYLYFILINDHKYVQIYNIININYNIFGFLVHTLR